MKAGVAGDEAADPEFGAGEMAAVGSGGGSAWKIMQSAPEIF